MAIDTGFAVVTADGRIAVSNPVFDLIFGAVPREQLLPRLGFDACRDGGKTSRPVTLADDRIYWMDISPFPEGWLISAVDISERMRQGMFGAELARTDRLTQLANRLVLRERLADLLVQPVEIRCDCAVLTIDLDRFKAINDTLGRSIGDALLCLVAKRISSALSESDVLARLDADEFGVIQMGRDQPEAAVILAKRLVDLLGRPYLLEGQIINVSAFVGIALLGDAELDVEGVLKNADLALHRAKQERYAGYRVFESAMDESMRARRALETDLRRALALREFSLVYQPQVNLQSRRVFAFEALLRWRCPTRGAVSPLEFIPIAEETGIIGPIGEWVLRTACRDAAGWPGDYTVAVNISAIQFANRSLVATVVSALADSGLDPRRLELEITESVMLDSRGNALAVLQQLRGLGVRVSLDDFGTGYSSLGYLRSFPFDKIKIDQSFVREASDDRGNRAIVRAIASLGASLGMATVAEGVETEDQLARVAADGCTEVQGYLISRPIPPGDIEHFLAESRNVIDAATAITL
ncbi:diguanylate cyclase/phosphodiesterase [Rhodopseudomonas thermotolerans]|uniref:Diguanylate cyclase/phosphodiesterase n=2 Tax=Rhodopseudomonas TaxID=1073 RepID=A0A336K100_9BRAD|nr:MULTISPECIES: bifunctional diguanylate cyclase/phosphodiesterase [Rhodopseudomonas]RED31258.1 diguanylate cyclase/phosphodiesterase [Rhodopseudomonas pentothenatexigens]REF92809.1 diguanylate cyclase/phosphodiesterase [Rhodopseudomonas thermotolerans]SSW91911.1 diguanylate cyclase/phosphodiesterase [Rhodopseudomonas pentothenatexigens]